MISQDSKENYELMHNFLHYSTIVFGLAGLLYIALLLYLLAFGSHVAGVVTKNDEIPKSGCFDVDENGEKRYEPRHSRRGYTLAFCSYGQIGVEYQNTLGEKLHSAVMNVTCGIGPGKCKPRHAVGDQVSVATLFGMPVMISSISFAELLAVPLG